MERQTRRDTLLHMEEYTRNDTLSHGEEYTRRDKQGRTQLGGAEGKKSVKCIRNHTPSDWRHTPKGTPGRTHTEVHEEINESTRSERHMEGGTHSMKITDGKIYAPRDIHRDTDKATWNRKKKEN